MKKAQADKSGEDISPSGQLLIPIEESRRRLGNIGHTKFYAEVAAGRLKLVKIGRRAFTTPAELERYVAALQEAV